MKDLTDACMCGEPFYGRPCIFCQSRERIERLEAVVDAADAIEHLVITHTQDEQADYVKFQESLAALIGESDES